MPNKDCVEISLFYGIVFNASGNIAKTQVFGTAKEVQDALYDAGYDHRTALCVNSIVGLPKPKPQHDLVEA